MAEKPKLILPLRVTNGGWLDVESRLAIWDGLHTLSVRVSRYVDFEVLDVSIGGWTLWNSNFSGIVTVKPEIKGLSPAYPYHSSQKLKDISLRELRLVGDVETAEKFPDSLPISSVDDAVNFWEVQFKGNLERQVREEIFGLEQNLKTFCGHLDFLTSGKLPQDDSY